jgi:hypothetical protein
MTPTTLMTPMTRPEPDATEHTPRRDPARENWKSVLIHPEDFERLKVAQKTQGTPHFDLGALASAAVGLVTSVDDSTQLLHAKAIADLKKRK